MNKCHVPITWVNDQAPAINDTHLNQYDGELDTLDDRVITLDTTKAAQSDMLLAFKDVSLNSTTGVITFTLFNNTTKTIDTLLEKVAINFDYDDDPTSPHYQNLIIELEDGTYKYIDMSALITEYEFTDSSTIDFTVTSGAVSASVIDGSITATKCDPTFALAISDAEANGLKSEGYANGTQNGTPVTSGSPYYENNAKYWKEQAQAIASQTLSGLTDVSIQSPHDGQALVYDGNSGEWVNKTVSSSRAPNNITSRLSDLLTAVSEQNLEKYGYKIGDYFVGASTYVYWLADLDTYYGGYNNNAVVNTHHIGLVIDTKSTSQWNSTSSIPSAGYGNCTLQSHLASTVLNNIKSDMIALFGGSTGLEHLLAHKKLWARIGSWAWSSTDQYISALTESQVYGAPICSADKYQQGESDKQLEIFSKFKYNRLFGEISFWLRSICNSTRACNAYLGGHALDSDVTNSDRRAVGLILLH